ncbi:sphingoid long-chain base transporter RSB1 [Periconia macrospinosa]|uniref:Sphingoid long-chain base transporter RSB1 n=1 Tax=Periconia macrospinosa TaxID=97972 RepID=A0A2V1DBJ2_9PLEO|nr:sphingoid long-chain base transporter RSB1 [Periconia macrospinosa]
MASILNAFLLLRRAQELASHPPNNCTIDTCPVEWSLYGYYPSLPANALFVALFAISMLLHIYQGIRWRSWSFMACMVIGTFGELVGYGGRITLHNNPFDQAGLKTQMIALTITPTFLAAGIYLTLKHTVVVIGPSFSRIEPRYYTWIFIACDIISIIIQVIGAGTTAQGDHADVGNGIMIAGLSFQVFTLSIFGIMALEYAVRFYKFRHRQNATTERFRNSVYFKGSMLAVATSYFTILVRCIYRVVEMAGGLRNPIMRDQNLFIALDSVMCAIAALILNAFHPGFMFQESANADKRMLESADEGVPM